MRKILFILTIAILYFCPTNKVLAQSFSAINNGKTIYYNITSSASPMTVEVIQFSNPYLEYFGSIEIPSSVIYNGNTYSVTSIGDNAFNFAYDLTSITIPNSITSIGNDVFSYCYSLTSITIPNSVTSIGSNVFEGCSGLTSIIISNSISSINDFAFAYCDGLTSITIPNSVISIGAYAFLGCSNLTSITIPNSVVSIGSSVFGGCSGLTSIEISNSITSISDDAFSGCTGLTSITIPNSVTSIGNYAFNGCISLASVIINNSVISIGSYSFDGCNGLTTITVPNSVTTIGNNAFSNCSNLSSIIIPNSVTSIGYSAFYNCRNLISISIPNSITMIQQGTFSKCSGLTSVIIPNSVTSIIDEAFDNCTALTSIMIPNSVISIGSYVFRGCSGLTSIIIPNSVTSIGGNIFESCTGLTSAILPNSINYINSNTFLNCIGLNSITIPNSVVSIGNSVFEGCSGLTSITIPDSVAVINYNAFYGCTGLTSITFPNSLDFIGNNAFSDCSGLTSIISNAMTPPSISNNTFDYSTIQDILVLCGSKEAYQNALNWSNFGNKIHIMDTNSVSICMVSANRNNHNEITWEKNEVVDSYNIYRAEFYNNQYNLLANIPFDSSNVWIDTSSKIDLYPYRYKVTRVNSGVESCIEESRPHKTILLTINQGINNTWDLYWNLYEGVDYQTYNIYRKTGDSLNSMQLLETIAGNNTSYSDLNAPSGYVYYVVEIVIENPCVNSKSTSSIFSNIATNNPNGISLTDIEVSKFKIYPNPVNNTLFIDGKGYDKAQIYDIIGREVLVSDKKEIDISDLPNGIYNVRILTKDKTLSTHKIIKE